MHPTPRLRQLDIRPVIHQGQHCFQFKDPQQISQQVLFVPQALALVLLYCDGAHSIEEMCTAFWQQYGAPIAVEVVEELLVAFDSALLLENERFYAARQNILQEYHRKPYREPALAGTVYPADASTLWRFLEGQIAQTAVSPAEVNWSHPVGVLSPHIDYQRGGHVYAQVWQRAAQAAREAELVILIGTDHGGSEPFTLTYQNYATPYGVLPTEQNIVANLVDVIGEQAAFAGELRHRGEHSLELVAIWLHHMRRGMAVPLVPLLVGSLAGFHAEGDLPTSHWQVREVIDTLRFATRQRRTLIVASGDLAHVGPAFGGDALDQGGRNLIKQQDDRLIQQMQRGDANGFYRDIQRIKNSNNVCGVTPIYLTLQAIDEICGESVGYAICPADRQNTSIVSVCGMMWP